MRTWIDKARATQVAGAPPRIATSASVPTIVGRTLGDRRQLRWPGRFRGRRRDAPPRAIVHIGAPKAGSTYLQDVLWANRASLGAVGIAVPGVAPIEHLRAGRDLRGVSFGADEPGGDGAGAWDLLARKVRQRREPTAVISAEHLAALGPQQVRRLVASLAPREVHAVYVARNLRGLLASEWQQYVKHGSTMGFPEWSEQVLTSPRSKAGRWFWKVHDPAKVIRRWSTALPVEQIHLLTVPPSAGDPTRLWRQFASVLGLEGSMELATTAPANASVGHAETELLRRVNAALPDSLSKWQHMSLVRSLLAEDILGATAATSRPALAPDLEPVLARRERRIRAGIRASGCDLVGTLRDLRSAAATPAAAPAPDDLVDAATGGIVGLLVEMAHRQELARATPPARALDALARRGSVARLLARVEGRSAHLDELVTRAAERAGERLRGTRS